MNWKKFFKPTKLKSLLLLSLLAATFFWGFFEMSNCFIDDNGEKICRLCGLEGIFNPLLRPVSFLIANIFKGLIESGSLQACGASSAMFTLLPFDLIYLYTISCSANHLYSKIKK